MRDLPTLRNLIVPVVLVTSLFGLQLYRASEVIPMWRYHGAVMGTSYTVQLVHKDKLKASVIQDALNRVNERMSTYISKSELSRLNRAEAQVTTSISAPLRRVLRAAKMIYEQSEGAFDITVGPLVNAWGFGPEGRKPTPTPDALTALRARSGDALWTLDEAGVVKERADLYLDLSAIAKGFAVDEVARALEARGVTRYWVEVGGEVRTRGANAEDKLWRVGIERPAPGEGRRIMQILSLRDLSIATSGDYRNRYRDARGVMHSHTIDPRTGEPIKHTLASVSVLHAENMFADAWATALNVLGAEAGLKLADQHQIAALFIVRDHVAEDATELDDGQTEYTLVESEAFKQYRKSLLK